MRKVKSHIYIELNPSKRNFYDPTRDDFEEESSIEDIFISLQIATSDYGAVNMINENIRLFNDKQHQVFGIVCKWSRDYIKNLNSRVLKKVTTFYIFLTGGGGEDKSHLM